MPFLALACSSGLERALFQEEGLEEGREGGAPSLLAPLLVVENDDLVLEDITDLSEMC